MTRAPYIVCPNVGQEFSGERESQASRQQSTLAQREGTPSSQARPSC